MDFGGRTMAWLKGRREPMVALLTALAERESPSVEPRNQAGLIDLLRRELAAAGLRARHLPGRTSGGQLFARPDSPCTGRPYQLLLGHIDTVWPLGTIESMPVRRTDGRLAGPGVYDMKGGIVQLLFALRALRALGSSPVVAPVVFLNTDEEIGSRDSRRSIVRLARRADRVFVLEPSLGPEGRLKTARAGVGRFVVKVHGRAAHAGLDPERGASAILELSSVIQRLFALNDPSRGISVNVGQIDGGLHANVVAAESRAVVDVRVRTREDGERIEQEILALRATTKGTWLEVEGGIGRPPMERTTDNAALWKLALEAGDVLGMRLEEGTAGGGSDGNFTSEVAPTLDGLGAVGDGAHARHEYVEIDALVQRAALLALLLVSPSVRDSAQREGGS